MSAQNTTAPEGRATEGQTDRQQRLQELSQHLIAILRNPETPESLFNDIAENLVDLVSPSHVELAELLPRYLGGEDMTPPTPEIPEAESASAPITGAAPQSRSDSQFHPITIQQAVELVNRILKYDDDDDALALVRLVNSIAYERDEQKRDDLATWTINQAYTLTMDFSGKVKAFVARANEMEIKRGASPSCL